MLRVLNVYVRLTTIIIAGCYISPRDSPSRVPASQPESHVLAAVPHSERKNLKHNRSAPGLPLELCQYILDFLWDDRDALLACTDVYPLNLRAEVMVANIYKITLDPLSTELDTENLTRDFLASPTFPLYFSKLTVQVQDRSSSSWCYKIPLRFASKLTRVENLTLLGVFDSHKTHFPLTTYFGFFRSVTIILLGDCTFPGFADMARFIISFPNLSELNIRNVDWSQYIVLPHILGKSRTKKMRLRKLGILAQCSVGRQDYLHQLLSWLHTTPVIKSLGILTVEVAFPANFEVLAHFLKTAGDALEQLKVYVVPGLLHGSHIPGEHDEVPLSTLTLNCMADYMSLDYLSSLQELEFTHIGPQDLPAFLSIFSHVSPQLRKITLQVRSQQPEDMNHPNWDLLEEHFAKNDFRNVALSLMFGITNVEGEGIDYRTKELLKRFPVMSARTEPLSKP